MIQVIDGNELRQRYDCAIESVYPSINYTLNLAGSKSCTMKSPDPGADCCRAAQGMRQAAGIKGGMLFQKTSGKASDEQDGQQGHPWDNKRSEFFFFHNGITALRWATR